MANRNRVAVLIPSAYRGERLVQCLASLKETHPCRNMTTVVSVVSDDLDSQMIAKGLADKVIVRTPEEYAKGAIYGWNQCLSAAKDFDYYVLGADDLFFDRWWLHYALGDLKSIGGSGLVGLNDLSSNGEVYAAHWLVSRDFLIDHLGGVMYPPMYKSWWCDREVTDIAQLFGKYIWSRLAIAEHFNPGFGKSGMDRTYREASLNYNADEQLYLQRKRLGFPVTWSPIVVK